MTEQSQSTANEAWRDAILRHIIGLQQFTAGLQRRATQTLDQTEGTLKRLIHETLGVLADERGTVTLRPRVVRQLRRLEREVAVLRGDAIQQAFAEVREELLTLLVQEPQAIDAALRTVVPVILDTTLPAATTLRALLTTAPVHGHLWSRWTKHVAQRDQERIITQLTIGIVQGEGIPQLAQRVVGTARIRGVDGATELTRREATTIVRTAVNHYSNRARDLYFEANQELFTEEAYVATLDARTTPICRSLDGKRFPVGKGPKPPLHLNCRSIRVAVISQELLGERPAKPVTERQLLREFTAQHRLAAVTTRAQLPRTRRAAYARFAQQRTRALIGRVPASTTYTEWLRTQSAAFQTDILGVTKAKLFRAGNLHLDRFVAPTGREYTLRELAQRERAAFIAAGLSPERWL